jgi:hypothetical protein
MAVQSPLRKVFRSVFSNTFNLTVNFLSRIGGGSVVTYLSRLMTTSTMTPFYSGTTNIVDSSATGDYREIQPGRCLDFNGATQYVEVADDPVLQLEKTDSFSLFAWVKTTDSSQSIISNQNGGANNWTGYLLYMNSDGTLQGQLASGGDISNVRSTGSYNDGEWHLLGFNYDGSESALGISLYADGADAGFDLLDDDLSGSIVSNAPLQIGYRINANSFDGLIHDARIYNRVLTDAEITAIYRQGLQPDSIVEGQPDSTNLVGRWLLDDNSQTTAYDSSGNGNHGTIVGYASGMLYEGDDVPYSQQNLVGWSPLTGFSNDVPEGLSGNAYRFDGVDDWIQVGGPNSLRPLTPTVSLWFKVNELDYIHTMFCSPNSGSSDGFMLRVQDSDNTIRAFFYSSGWKDAVSDGPVELNRWTHAAMTYDGSTLKLYVDGVLQSDTASFTHSSWSDVISLSGFIGRYHSVPEFYRLMKGMVKDVRVYNTGLTQDNISFLANKGGLDPGSANLVGHWELDGDLTESSGNVDLSTATAFGNNGEILSRDESDPANDVLGNPLDYTGLVPKYATPVDAPCLTFNGTTQSILINNQCYWEDWDTDKYFECYFRVATLKGQQGLLGCAGGYNDRNIGLDADNKPNYCFANGTVNGVSLTDAVETGRDYKITWSWDSALQTATFSLFDLSNNGVLVESKTTSHTGMSENLGVKTHIGCRRTSEPATYFDGLIWNVKVQSSGPTNGDGNIWLPMSEGDGNTVYDVVNGNSYTITGYASTMWDITQSEFFYSFENGCNTHSNILSDEPNVKSAGWSGDRLEAVAIDAPAYNSLQFNGLSDGVEYRVTFDYVITSGELNLRIGGTANNGKFTGTGSADVTASSVGVQEALIIRSNDPGTPLNAVVTNIKCSVVGVSVPALYDGTATVTGEPITGLPGLLNSDTYNLNLLPEPDAPYQRSAIPGATFDGVGDYVDTGVTSVPDEITIETVLKMPSSFGLRLAFGGYGSPPSKDRLYIGCNASGQVIAGCADKYQNTLISSSSFSVNEWLSIRMIVGAGVVQVFVNDVLEIDDTYTQTLPFALPRIGRVVIYYWPSSIQSVSYSGLFAYDFRENNGLIIPDRSGNGNDGTLVVNSSLAQIFAPTALETAYTLGDGRTRPHYVTIDGPNEKDFRTEII